MVAPAACTLKGCSVLREQPVSSLPFGSSNFPRGRLRDRRETTQILPQFPLCLPILVRAAHANNVGVYLKGAAGVPSRMQWLNSARRHFYFGCFSEVALLGVAAIVGFIFNYRMFQDLSWLPMDVFWGTLATLPLLMSFGWLLNSRVNFAAAIRRFFEHILRPLFANWSLLELAVISTLAGLCEEVLFRGAIQGGLTRLIGAPAALAIASIAFGLAHPISKQYIIAATVIGFLLGCLFLVRGNLLAPIVTHAVYDFCALTWFLRLHRSDPR